MLFEELPIYRAVHRVWQRLDQPGAENWTTNCDQRKELTKLLVTALVDEADQALIDAWVRYRKSPTVGPESARIKKLTLLIEVAETHGATCFYAGRGLGPCSIDLDLDRIKPGSDGGEYTLANCLIACSNHNRSRGDIPLVDFLSGARL